MESRRQLAPQLVPGENRVEAQMSEPLSFWPPNWSAVDNAIQMLNWTLRQDGKAFQELLERSVPAAPAWVDSFRLQCYQEDAGEGTVAGVDYGPQLRVLGLINGLFGAAPNGWGLIGAVYKDHKLVGFQRVDAKHLGLNEDYTVPG